MAAITVRNTGTRIVNETEVRQFLTDNNVFYEHWDTAKIPPRLQNLFTLTDDDKQEILDSLESDIERLAKSRGYVKWDIIALSSATPDLDALLKKFEQVHTHTEDEVRAITAGSGSFIIKGPGDVGYFDVALQPGDVISVPEHQPHFFTLDADRKVVAVRLFIDPSGWVAHPFNDPDV